MDRINEAELTEKVQTILLGLDGGWHDGVELFVSALKGGIGNTRCSIRLLVSDADSFEREYVVEAHLVEDDE